MIADVTLRTNDIEHTRTVYVAMPDKIDLDQKNARRYSLRYGCFAPGMRDASSDDGNVTVCEAVNFITSTET